MCHSFARLEAVHSVVESFTPSRRGTSSGITSVAVAIPHAGHTESLERCLSALAGEEPVVEAIVVVPEFAAESACLVIERHRRTAIVTSNLEPFAIATNRAVE